MGRGRPERGLASDGSTRGPARDNPDRGSVSVVLVGVIAAVFTVALGAAHLSAAVSATRAASAAADLSALAGAHAELAGADGCRAAQQIAQANGASVQWCETSAAFVNTVEVSVPVGFAFPGAARSARAVARAGPVVDAALPARTRRGTVP